VISPLRDSRGGLSFATMNEARFSSVSETKL
jgi:hypothetical protein